MKPIYILVAGETGCGKSMFLDALVGALQQSGVLCEKKFLMDREMRALQLDKEVIVVTPMEQQKS